MFELGKKDSEAAQAAARQPDNSASAASAAGARRTGTGQFAVIGRSIQINGDVKGDEDLMIEGDVSGTVELRNHSLTVGKEGKVKANIFARAITVDGTTEGDMFASERISVRATANVRGNLLAPRVSLGLRGSMRRIAVIRESSRCVAVGLFAFGPPPLLKPKSLPLV